MEKQGEPSFEELGDIQRLKRELSEEKRRRRDEAILSAESRELLKVLEENILARPEIPRPRAAKKNLGRTACDGLVHISDVHYGEVVRLESTGGLAEYNPDIARERLEFVADKTIELGKEQKIDKLTVVWGGDMQSGMIHDDLERSNQEMVVRQTLDMSDITTEMLERFAGAFPLVEVDGRSGNHGRPYRPMFFNRKQTENWDFVLYKMQEFRLSNNKRIKFLTNESFWNVVESGNRKFLTMHGDTIKHANSMSLPWYSMFKELLKFMAMREHGGVPHFDDMLIGHFHNPAAIQMGDSTLRVAPAVKGPDDYSYAGSRIPVPSGFRYLNVADKKVQSDHLIDLESVYGKA